MIGVARLAQVADHVVGVQIDNESAQEDHCTDDEPWITHPIGVIRRIHRCDVEQPVALHVAVNQVPRHRQAHDDHRHLAVAAHQQREDKRALEIMQLKDQEEQQVRNIAAHGRDSPQVQHGNKHRHLHQKPAYLVVDGRSPLLGAHLAVTGVNKIQRHKHDKANQSHYKQEVVKEFYRVQMIHNIIYDFSINDLQFDYLRFAIYLHGLSHPNYAQANCKGTTIIRHLQAKSRLFFPQACFFFHLTNKQTNHDKCNPEPFT